MKSTLLLSAVLLAAGAASAQTPTTVSTAPGNAEQVWYSLQNGVVASAPLADWDLAFEITGFNASILVNTAKGLTVYETPYPISEWDNVDSPDPDNWTELYNADSNWSAGALTHGNNLDDPEGLNLGWGNYNMVTHTVVGSKIYALQLADGTTWLKLRINALAGGAYTFTYANLDGTNAHDGTLAKADFADKNFGYWSFATNATLDPEPPTADWDLLFTKYTAFVPTPYGVTGVLQNKAVSALQVDGVPPEDAGWTSASFSDYVNVIGSDWKEFDMGSFQYVIQADRTYFVKDLAGNVWKLVFTAFGGAATGDISFNQELVSATGVAEQAAARGSLLVAPNPVAGGQARIVLDVPGTEGLLSVFNTAGQQVMQQQLSGLSGLTGRTLDVAGLQQGIYVLHLSGAGYQATAKLVIE